MLLELATSAEKPMRRSTSADGLNQFARRRSRTLRDRRLFDPTESSATNLIQSSKVRSTKFVDDRCDDDS